jgi:aryl carrier-like protein
MPAVKGCIQAAMVLADSGFSTMSIDSWQQCTRPKVQGTWNLHLALPVLDFMVILSSACGVIGHVGQSNYAAGNTFQDAVARYRVASGQKTVSLDLGIILGQGYVAENENVMESLLRLNLLHPLAITEVFALLDYYCNPAVKITLDESQTITGLKLPKDVISDGKDIPSAIQKPLFRCLLQGAPSWDAGTSPVSKALSFKQSFIEAASLDEVSIIASNAFRAKLCRVLGMVAGSIHEESSLISYGVDSLVGMELRNWLEWELGAVLTVFEILGGASAIEIGKIVASKSIFCDELRLRR